MRLLVLVLGSFVIAFAITGIVLLFEDQPRNYVREHAELCAEYQGVSLEDDEGDFALLAYLLCQIRGELWGHADAYAEQHATQEMPADDLGDMAHEYVTTHWWELDPESADFNRAARAMAEFKVRAELDRVHQLERHLAKPLIPTAPASGGFPAMRLEIGDGELCAGHMLLWIQIARDRGDWDEYSGLVELNLNLAQGLSCVLGLRSHNAARGIWSITLHQIRSDLLLHDIPTEYLRRLQQLFDKSSIAPITMSLEGDRLAMLDSWARSVATPKGFDDVNLVFDAAIDRLSNDPSERERGSERITRFNKRMEEMLEDEDYLTAAGFSLGMPRPSWIRNSLRVHRTRVAGTRLMIALRLYADEHGRYPDGLDELVPEFIDDAPDDAVGQQQFVYRTTDPAADPHGRPYLLYSVGRDNEDNGGKLHPEGNGNALGGKGHEGYDYIINDPGR